MVGKVDKPASTVNPVTPMDIGLDERLRFVLCNIPQFNLPSDVVNPIFN